MRFLSIVAVVITLAPLHLGSEPQVQTLDALEVSPVKHPWP